MRLNCVFLFLAVAIKRNFKSPAAIATRDRNKLFIGIRARAHVNDVAFGFHLAQRLVKRSARSRTVAEIFSPAKKSAGAFHKM